MFLEKYKRNIQKIERNNKPSHKSINTTIVPVVIGDPMLSLFPNYFLWVFPGPFHLCQVTRLLTTDPTVIFPFFSLLQWLRTHYPLHRVSDTVSIAPLRFFSGFFVSDCNVILQVNLLQKVAFDILYTNKFLKSSL